MDAHPNPRNRADPELILCTPLPEPFAASATAASATRSVTTDTASPLEPLCSASDPGNRALYSKKKTVFLCDWWLLWAREAHEGRRLSVGGVVAERYKGPCRHKDDRSGSKFLVSPWQKAERVFESAPITKRYNSFTLGTADGISVRIQGVINKTCSHQNGISPEVSNSFLIGFPYNWDNYSGACFEGKSNSASVLESAASANEISEGLADPEGCLFPVLLDDFSLSRIHDGSVTRKFRDFLEKFCYTTKPLASDAHNRSSPLVQSGLPHEPPSKYERAIVLAQVTEGLEHVARFEEFSCLSPRDHQSILVESLDLTPPWKGISEKEKYEKERIRQKLGKGISEKEKYEKERIRQKHGNDSNHVVEGYVVGSPEAAGCYIDGLQGDEVDGRVNERMKNVEDIPATDATSISRTTKSKNQGGVDGTISSLKAETNGDKIVRVDHSSVKTVNDDKYKRRNLSACDLPSARAVYFTLESSKTNLQIDPAPTSDTQGGRLADEQISVNTGDESEFLKSSIANKTQSDNIMGIHSTKEKILDLSITKNQNNQSKRGKKKKQNPLSVYQAYKKSRLLHSSGRAIWRPSYDNQYPLTRDTAKKLCIASPESLNLKRSRSGRLLVPPIAEWCQKIIYAANGAITAITGEGLENFPCIESRSEPPRKRKRLV